MEIDPNADKQSLKKDQKRLPITVGIFDSSEQGTMLPMDDEKYKKLYESINNALFEDIDKYDVLPTFTKNEHISGVMKIDCANLEAKSWLTHVIQRINPLWQNMHLKVDDFDKITPQSQVIGLFPYCKLTAKQIHHMLSAMNPDLNINSWTIVRSEATERSVQVVFDISEIELISLSERNFTLYFGAGFCPFWDFSQKHGDAWLPRNPYHPRLEYIYV